MKIAASVTACILSAMLLAMPARAANSSDPKEGPAVLMLFLAVCMDFQGVYTQQLNICSKAYPETADRFDKALAGWNRRNASQIPRVAKFCEAELRNFLNVNEDVAASAVEMQRFFVDHLRGEIRADGVVACNKFMAFLESDAQDLSRTFPENGEGTKAK